MGATTAQREKSCPSGDSICLSDILSKIALDPGICSRLYNPRVTDKAGKKGLLRAGELARLAGVSTDTLRHYERRGLLRPHRLPNGYREYPPQAVARVRLVRRALALGFRLDDLSRILRARDQGRAPCRQVRELAAAKLDELETLLRELTAARDGLRALLKEWDQRLEAAASEPAGLLESLGAADSRLSETPALPVAWQKRKRK
ncbi:MAG: heavy metal-responsive transcriptional regulator [Blastocatellia bacterium]